MVKLLYILYTYVSGILVVYLSARVISLVPVASTIGIIGGTLVAALAFRNFVVWHVERKDS